MGQWFLVKRGYAVRFNMGVHVLPLDQVLGQDWGSHGWSMRNWLCSQQIWPYAGRVPELIPLHLRVNLEKVNLGAVVNERCMPP